MNSPGQGGTRLSDDELVYSLIKDTYPLAHDRIEAITKGPGKFASEVDLVLGALRVAQALAPLDEAKEWEKFGRPTPERISQLHTRGAKRTEPYFRRILNLDGQGILNKDGDFPCKLEMVIENLRDGLRYAVGSNPSGLPSMLLARLPRELLDVLLLFSFKSDEPRDWKGKDRETLIAFVLHWLLFVGDNGNASNQSFVVVEPSGWDFGTSSIAALIGHLESEGIARRAPRKADWETLEQEVRGRGCRLAAWSERFSSKDNERDKSPGESLRVLSTNDEMIKRALLWLQRRYIDRAFPHYDPTSTRDDDLPFDIDHAIPSAQFGFHWGVNVATERLALSDIDAEQFKQHRSTVGNSLGNKRWLAAPDNRRKQDKQIEAERSNGGKEPPVDDEINRDVWNRLIDKKPWTEDDVYLFQEIIDERALTLVKRLLSESKIEELLELLDKSVRQ